MTKTNVYKSILYNFYFSFFARAILRKMVRIFNTLMLFFPYLFFFEMIMSIVWMSLLSEFEISESSMFLDKSRMDILVNERHNIISSLSID